MALSAAPAVIAIGPVLALDTQTPEPTMRWQHASGGAYVPTGLIYQDRLYLVDDNGMMRCLKVDDGSQVWKERLGAPVSASLVAGAGKIYVAAESGDVFVIAAADQFQLLSKNPLGERIQATPAIVGQSLLVRSAGHLYCFADKSIGDGTSEVENPAGDEAAEITAPSPSDAVISSDTAASG
mgnify:FL=1